MNKKKEVYNFLKKHEGLKTADAWLKNVNNPVIKFNGNKSIETETTIHKAIDTFAWWSIDTVLPAQKWDSLHDKYRGIPITKQIVVEQSYIT